MTLETNYLRGPDARFSQIDEKDLETPMDFSVEALRGKKVLIIAAGGPAPGLSEVVKNITSLLYNSAQCYGLDGGFSSMDCPEESVNLLIPERVVTTRHIQASFTGRTTPFDHLSTHSTLMVNMGRDGNDRSEQVASYLMQNNFDVLLTIGGDGTLKATQGIEKVLRSLGSGIQIAHLPKTVDGDVRDSKTFGLATAAEYVVGQVEAHTLEQRTNGLNSVVNIIEAMGWGSGKLVYEVATISSKVDLAIGPELPISVDRIAKKVREAIAAGKGLNIVIAEGVKSIDGICLPKRAEGDHVTLTNQERMINPLSEYLAQTFGPEGLKVNSKPRDYTQRAISAANSQDMALINGMTDTTLRLLAKGNLGFSILDCGKALDLTKPRTDGNRYPITRETRAALIRQGYTAQELNDVFQR